MPTCQLLDARMDLPIQQCGNSAATPSPIPLSGATDSAVGERGQTASKPLIYIMVLTPKGRFSGAGMDFSPVDRGNSDDAVLAQPLHLVGGDAAARAQQSTGVLAELGWAAQLDRGVRQLDRTADGLIGAAGRIVD